MYLLAFSHLRLRAAAEPEYAHPAWNNVLGAVQKTGLQPTILVATLLTHVNHGPYFSGRNLQLKQDMCREWIETMDNQTWEQLRDSIAADRCTTADSDDVPQCREDLLKEPTIASRGIFEPGIRNREMLKKYVLIEH